MDKLQKRRMVIKSAYPMCLADKGIGISIASKLLTGSDALEVDYWVVRSELCPSTYYHGPFQGMKINGGSLNGKAMHRASFLAAL